MRETREPVSEEGFGLHLLTMLAVECKFSSLGPGETCGAREAKATRARSPPSSGAKAVLQSIAELGNRDDWMLSKVGLSPVEELCSRTDGRGRIKRRWRMKSCAG